MSKLIERDFRDITDSMSSIIEEIDRYKLEYKIEEANALADSHKNEIGDMMSPEAINELENAIRIVDSIVLAKKRFAFFSDTVPDLMYKNQILVGQAEMDIIPPNENNNEGGED